MITGKEIQINLAGSDIFMRQPKVTVVGETNFHNLYGYGYIGNTLGTTGSDLIIKGQVSFKSEYSDKYTITNDTSYKGTLFGRAN